MHQKLVQWIYALRRFKEISQRLGSFEQFGELSMVRRAFKNYLVYNSCNSRDGIDRGDDESKLA